MKEWILVVFKSFSVQYFVTQHYNINTPTMVVSAVLVIHPGKGHLCQEID